jgi:hypothetical protein
MSAVVNRKAKITLERIVRDGLCAALSSDASNNGVMNPKAIATISRRLVDGLILNSQFIECVRSLAPESNKELITTEDAARLSGFSRPVIIALLDSNVYPGHVMRTPKGHRRLERGEFVAWLETVVVPKDLPKTLQDVRSGPRDEEPKRSRGTKADSAAQQSERRKRV